MSTTLQDPNLEPASSTSTLIALIGPNAAHRGIMAKALTGSESRTVREFIDYPASLSDIPQLMEENFDVVMIDVDSDQSYALQIVETIAALNSAIVMVYSMRNDPDLLRECMRAGARDFLPLPDEAGGAPAPAAVEASEVPVAPPEELEAINPADFLLPEPVDAPIAPEAQTAPEPQITRAVAETKPYSAPSYNYSAAPRRPDLQPFSQAPASRQPDAQPQPRPEDLRLSIAPSQPVEPSSAAVSPSTDFSEWDSLWIRTTLPAAAKSTDNGSHLPAAVEPVTKKKSGPTALQSGPQLVACTPAPVEIAVPAPPLFRQVDSNDTVQSRRPWVRWALFAGVPLVIIGLLMLVFMPSTRSSAPVAPHIQSDAAQGERSAMDAETASAKPRSTVKPSPASLSSVLQAKAEPTQTAPVSSDMMNAQLSAPSRISDQMKKPGPVEEAPAGFSPSAIESGDAIPGQVFAGQNKVRVVPSVSAISAGVAEGMLLHKTAPVYPEFAKAARVSGTVLLGATITKAGTIAGLHVISGPAILRGPAADAVKNWHYRPYMLNNQPVEVQTTIKLVFTLDQH
jgi:protein TonB